jgi:hypothetical protein
MRMTDRYRLAPVRDERNREERVQRGNLAATIEQARASEQQVAAAAARVTAAETALADARLVSAESTALAHARTERFVAKLRAAVELARDEHARAVASHRGQLATVDAARIRLTRARADREVIERHFARWREERQKLADRRED